MAPTPGTQREDTTLDLLEREDNEVLRLFDELENADGSSVEERAAYGDEAKQLIRHISTREAALMDIIDSLAEFPDLIDLVERLDRYTHERRTLISHLEHMSRGVPGISLNTGQEFDAELAPLARIVRTEIDWELSRAIPLIRRLTDEETRHASLQGADHAAKHAPTNLNPDGPRWYDRAPVISRLITIYDRLRDYPRASRAARH
ncbi:MAG TPA: hypothetical protein VG298_10650 [Acidimicrobiales bacterium]|jgi:hypothetical protein|nr:hypothetical protein [Acidimicrobiales bacterium]